MKKIDKLPAALRRKGTRNRNWTSCPYPFMRGRDLHDTKVVLSEGGVHVTRSYGPGPEGYLPTFKRLRHRSQRRGANRHRKPAQRIPGPVRFTCHKGSRWCSREADSNSNSSSSSLTTTVTGVTTNTNSRNNSNVMRLPLHQPSSEIDGNVDCLRFKFDQGWTSFSPYFTNL